MPTSAELTWVVTNVDSVQIDNGVGLTRDFLVEIEDDISILGIHEQLDTLTIVTGELGSRVYTDYVFPLFTKHGVRSLPQMVTVENRFFGDSVTVSGLLTTEDIIPALRKHGSQEAVLLPPNMVNYEDCFIDGPGIEDFQQLLGCPVIVCEESLVQSIHDYFADGGVDA